MKGRGTGRQETPAEWVIKPARCLVFVCDLDYIMNREWVPYDPWGPW